MSFCVSFYTLQCGNIARLYVHSFTTARPCFQLFCQTAEHQTDSQRSRPATQTHLEMRGDGVRRNSFRDVLQILS